MKPNLSILFEKTLPSSGLVEGWTDI